MIEGQKILRVDELYMQLEGDVSRDYAGENKMLLNIYTADDIIAMGFCRNNILSILSHSTEDEIKEYFDRYVKDLPIKELDVIEVMDSQGNTTVIQAINSVIRQAVAIHLNIKLSTFIKELKKEVGDKDVN